MKILMNINFQLITITLKSHKPKSPMLIKGLKKEERQEVTRSNRIILMLPSCHPFLQFFSTAVAVMAIQETASFTFTDIVGSFLLLNKAINERIQKLQRGY